MNITLKTLPEATNQQVFDQVATHLLTQGIQSKYGGNCVYRTPAGLKCAAGCLIGDDEYVPAMDNSVDTSWDGMISLELVPDDHYELIASLQKIHDHYMPNHSDGAVDRMGAITRTVEKLRSLAIGQNLNTRTLDEAYQAFLKRSK